METTRILDEIVVPGKRLGRHVHFDDRSKNYTMSGTIPGLDPNKLFDKNWSRAVQPFDQGNLGSCTGNGSLGLLATRPFVTPGAAGSTTPDGDVRPNLAEQTAVLIYGKATELDGFGSSPSDIYPPDDRGSSALAAMKALQFMGFVKNYAWGMSSQEVLATLCQHGPVCVGFNWYDTFDTPDSKGLVQITPSAQVRGGHCFYLCSVDVTEKLVYGWNSWGNGWGLGGAFGFSWDTLDRLLAEEGEAVTVVM